MIEKIVNKITSEIVRQGVVSEENIPVFRYGLLSMIEISIIVLTMLLISVSLGRIFEAGALIGTIIVFRSLEGGYHARTFKSCYLISVIVFILTLLAVDLMSQKLFPAAVITCSIISILILVYLRTGPTRSREAENVNRHRFYKAAILAHLLYYSFIITMFISGTTNIILLTCSFGYAISQVTVFIEYRR
ncbi:accessory gene regulator B family protein [Paenibacillus sp. BR2-3]|uniref:accessory gene regulator B family protein n=1 Tax=Paenibacillus sp. BR2-3 TaxID=3048494 RepID=UPI0039774ECE